MERCFASISQLEEAETAYAEKQETTHEYAKLKDFIENPHDLHSKIEQEYVSKYFELGKRYYAKRNNFKILFRNYLRFIGKIMIIKNNL